MKATSTSLWMLGLLLLNAIHAFQSNAFGLAHPTLRHANSYGTILPYMHYTMYGCGCECINRRTCLWSKEPSLNEEGGSVAGASLLFAGTAVGAGMLALPAETIDTGFVPTIIGLIVCCIFTYVTSILVLEASWLVSCEDTCGVESEENGGGFLLIARRALGLPGEVITAVLFCFLLTAIIVAYTAEGGQLISAILHEVLGKSITSAAGSLLFASFFGMLAIYGTPKVDAINRVFVLGLVGSFVALVAKGLPLMHVSNLTGKADWATVYPTVISIGILSFGAQNVVPTLFRYLKNNPERTRQAILYGTLMPLILYSIWEAVFIGVIDSRAAASSIDKMDVINVLGKTGGRVVTDFVEIFSMCAIGSSMAGASVSLVDFFEDASNIFSSEKEAEVVSQDPVPSYRLFAAAIALGPPVILAYAFPDVFLVALEEAGLLGGVMLYGLLPAISILALRGSSPNSIMPGRLGGGYLSLLMIVGLSSALVLPELIRLFSMLLIVE